MPDSEDAPVISFASKPLAHPPPFPLQALSLIPPVEFMSKQKPLTRQTSTEICVEPPVFDGYLTREITSQIGVLLVDLMNVLDNSRFLERLDGLSR